MSDFYSDMRDIAGQLIGEFAQGSPVYVALTPGNGPKDRPGAPTETQYPLVGVARGVSQRYIDSTTIVASDLQVTIAAGGIRPDISGLVKIGTKQYKIVRVIDTPATGTIVTHTIVFRDSV